MKIVLNIPMQGQFLNPCPRSSKIGVAIFGTLCIAKIFEKIFKEKELYYLVLYLICEINLIDVVN